MSTITKEKNREILKQLLLQKAAEASLDYPLSYGQQALWYIYKEAPESAAYNLAFPLRIKSELDVKSLRKAFQKLVNRHHSLRTTFSDNEGELSQVVHGYQQVYFKEVDAFNLNEDQLYNMVLQVHNKPFDLEKGPLFRVNLFKVKDDDYILLISAHHIITDFQSFLIMNDEIWRLYEEELSGNKQINPVGEIQYLDFVSNQKRIVDSSENEEHWKYWQDKLSGELSSLSLPIDKPRPIVQTYNGSSIPFTISKEITKALKELALEEGVTLFVLLETVYQLFLHLYSGQDDIIVGIPVNGRSEKNFDKMIGYLVNMLAIRVDFKENKTFKNLLQDVRATITEALKHQDYPFVSLVDRLKIKRDPSRSPVFQVTFEYLNYNNHKGTENGSTNNLRFEPYDIPQQEGQFDMILTLEDVGDYFKGKFNYNTDLFDEDTIKKMTIHFNNLLKGIVNNTNIAISDIPLLTQEEVDDQLYNYNNTKANHPLNKCIHKLFEEIAEDVPNNIAVSHNGINMTYEELNNKANQLARRLKFDGVRKDYIVGIMANRSIECVIGMLAVLKAGGAYLPIDPSYPEERVKLILEDSETEILLTQKNLKSVDYFKGITIYIDDDISYEHNDHNLNNNVSPNDLAYIIYTSGSTGKPKGAMIEHKGVVNYISWAISQYGNNKKDLTFPLYSSISFDLTVTSIFAPLLSGNTIEIYGEDDFCLDRIIKEDKVDVIKLTPSHLKALLNEDINNKRLKSFIVGGEEFERKVAEEIDKKFNHNIIQYNEYGPTETVVGCMIYAYDRHVDKDRAVPIGVPSDNVKLYIFNKHKRLVPDNVIGELYIGGEGVCRGYFNREDLTKERFIENPYIKGERIYKTGDLVKRRRDGVIEFVGRVDQQVKIRGYRIECGEIEDYLNKINRINEAVVVIKEDNNKEKYLCCYYVSSSNINDNEIRNELTDKMPNYMIPSKFIQLDSMPLNQNGKINRKLLTNKPVESSGNNDYVQASNELEKELCSIWENVLKSPKVGVHDNFFNLGGNSLLAIQTVQKIRKMGLTCKTSTLLQYPTVKELVRIIQETNNINVAKEERDEVEEIIQGKIELTPVQKWFFEKFEDVNQFNQYVLLDTNKKPNIKHVEEALKIIINNHDILKASYFKKNNEWVQNIGEIREYPTVKVENLSHISEDEQNVLIQKYISSAEMKFDISRPPLIKATYFILGENKGTLLLNIHHLVTDYVSFNIIIEDLNICYDQLSVEKEANLPNKSTSFGTFTSSLIRYSQDNDFTKDIKYWSLANDVPSLNVDYSLNKEEYRADKIITLNKNVSERILKNIPEEYEVKSHELVLTSIVEAYSNWSGYNKVLIDFEGHGREEIDNSNDLTRTAGWFTSMYPIYIELDEKNNGPLRRINEVKKQIHKVNKGFNFGILKYIKKEEDIINLPEPQIGFNYLGNLDSQSTGRTFELNDLRLSSSKLNQLPYLLHFNTVEVKEQIHIMLSYSSKLFDEDNISSLVEEIYEIISNKTTYLLEDINNEIKVCKKCILPETFPKIEIDEDGVCNYCKESSNVVVDETKDFKDEEDLLNSLDKYKNLNSKYDVLVPLSGGVDSSAALIEIVTKYKLRVLGFHNDHGYEDETATNNVKKLCKALDVDLIIKQHDTPFMKKLWKHTSKSKVKGLSGCFVCGGILYANAVEIADIYDIPLIINGYSKGQAMMMANKETALEFWEKMIEEFQEDEQFFEEFMERQRPMSKQKVYLTRADLEANVDREKILVIPFYIFKFNKTDKVILRKKCEAMFDWRQMKTSYPGRTTNCDMVWLNTAMDLKRMQHTMYHEEYASLVRKGEITRTQALADLEFNPPEGILEKLAKDIDLDLKV